MRRLLQGKLPARDGSPAGPLARVLVAVDGSDQGFAACRAAVAIAGRFGAAVTALHVAVRRPRSSLETSAEAMELAQEAARSSGRQILEEAREIAGGSVPFTTELIFGEPADTICRRAEELDADLVVVGARGLGKFERVLLGSVSAAVAGCTRRSLLVVRSA